MASRGLTKQGKSAIAKTAGKVQQRTRTMADDDYKRGEMEISEQEKTFNGFMRYSVNIGIFCIAVVIFLAIFAV